MHAVEGQVPQQGRPVFHAVEYRPGVPRLSLIGAASLRTFPAGLRTILTVPVLVFRTFLGTGLANLLTIIDQSLNVGIGGGQYL